ncbi:radical SAM protein [Candidatus Dependentiae bacterium]|nr:radical SAM protein [Candidatus Dependentiae bacterium]
MRIVIFSIKTYDYEVLNIGLASLASMVKKSGHEIKLENLPHKGADRAQIAFKVISDFHPDIIGFSIMCDNYKKSYDIAREIKNKFRLPIVFGGAQVYYLRDEILSKNDFIDYAFCGETEKTFPKFLDLFHQKQFEDINGLIYRDGGKIKFNGKGDVISNLDLLSFPDFTAYGVSEIKEYYLMTSRGCPFHCFFCNPFMGGKWRGHSPDYVVEELKQAKKIYKIKEFIVVEPVFNYDIQRVEEICDKLIEQKLDLKWRIGSGLRADRITDRMIKKMKAAGCYYIYMGVESLVPEVFENADKKEALEEIYKASKIVKNNGLKLGGAFIIGLPGDNLKNTIKSFELSRKLKFDITNWSFLIPYPNTKAYTWVQDNAANIYSSYEEAGQLYDGLNFSEFNIPFDTKEYPLDERIQARKIIMWKQKNYPINWKESNLKKMIIILKGVLKYDKKYIFSHLKNILRLIIKNIFYFNKPAENSKNLKYDEKL